LFIRHEKSIKEYYSRFPVTALLLALITAVMAVTYFVDSRFGEWTFSGYTGITPDMMERGQYWKLMTAAFVHAGLAHFIANFSSLLLLGSPLESILGKIRYVVLIVICALASSLSVFYLGSQSAVGASGICFGMMGVYLYLILFRKGVLDPQSVKFVWIWFVIAWVYSFLMPDISISGHFGGLVGGLLFSFMAIRKSGRVPIGEKPEREVQDL
jgi:rhomboid protease GluP